MDSIRRGLGSKSEAYKKYLRTLLRESAVTLPDSELRAAFERETDPVMLEHLAAAMVARTERGADPEAMKAVAKRALEERDPAVRAATLRALRRTSALENTGDMYERLVRDPSPEVRQEAATNIVEDIQNVYSGFHGPASDSAVSAAVASSDPKVTAKILGNLDTEKIGAESAQQAPVAAAQRGCRGAPGGGHRARRSARGGDGQRPRSPCSPCTATRGIPGCARPSSRASPSWASPARCPTCQRLRSVDPSLAPEIDTWIRVLSMDLQEWNLILREKQRLQQVP